MSKKTQTKELSDKQPLNIGGVSGSILIYSNSFTEKNLIAKSNINFFNTPVVFEFTEDFISIRKPSLDFRGKTIKMTHKNSGWYGTTFSKDLPEGKFIFDEEESNEDELIAYYH